MTQVLKQRIRNLDLGTLRSFITIAESGSMTKAATRLFMTQSAISMQIKRLEDSLDLSLFERSAQGMKVTPAGAQLRSYARKMLALNDEIWGRLTSPDYEGQVRIGVPSDIIYPHIPEILKTFRRDFPRVEIQLSSAVSQTLIDDFSKGRHDIVLTTEVQPLKGGQIIARNPLVWIGAEQGIAWKQRPIPLGFSSQCAFKPATVEALDKAGIPWTIVTVTDDEQVINALTAADLCVAAELASSQHNASGIIEHDGSLPELPDFSIIMYHDQQPGNHLTQALSDYIVRSYA